MIVIATDGSEAADQARVVGLEVARALGDDVLFVSVWSMVESGFGVPYAHMDELIEADKSRANEVLAVASEAAAKAGVTATRVLLEGNPVVEICQAAEQHDARMIVIGSHGWGVLRGLVQGSVAAGVLRHAHCPVLRGPPA